ncbi:MAG: methyl-accepting chemotaxis protein [Geminicoccaceae bacterium]
MATLASLSVFASYQSYSLLRDLEITVNQVTDVAAPSVETIDDMIYSVAELHKVAVEILADENVSNFPARLAEAEDARARYLVASEELREIIVDPQRESERATADGKMSSMIETYERMVARHREELEEESSAERQLSEADQFGDGLAERLQQIADSNVREMQAAEDEADRLVTVDSADKADINDIVGELFERDYPAVDAAKSLIALVGELESEMQSYLMSEVRDELPAIRARFDNLVDRSNGRFDMLLSVAETDDDKTTYEALRHEFVTWVTALGGDEKLFDTHRDMLDAELAADDLAENLDDVADDLIATLDAFAESADAFSRSADERVAEAIQSGTTRLSIWTLAIVGISLAMMAVVLISVLRPLGNLNEVMDSLASGDISMEVPAIDRHDEIGRMARAVQVFKQNAIEKARLRDEALEMADIFERSVKGLVDSLRGEAQSFVDKGREADSIGETAGTAIDGIGDALGVTGTNIQGTAAAVDEMTHSIGDISQRTQESSGLVSKAYDFAMDTDEASRKLNESANAISNVISIISDIAEQTNLLALNATIEAARAGDAGKGFAVVASEVKQLASQAGNATRSIADQIALMQAATETTTDKIAMVRQMVNQTNENIGSIAAAIEQQNTSCKEVSRNISEIATQSENVSNSFDSVRQSTEQSLDMISLIASSAGGLKERADNLNGNVDSFLVQFRKMIA